MRDTERLLKVVATCGLMTLLLAISVYGFMHAAARTDVAVEVARVAAQAAANIGISAFVTYSVFRFLAQREEERTEHNLRVDGVTAAVQQLKAGFEQVQTFRFMIQADPTASRFLTEFPRLLGAREGLQRLQRERFVADNPVVVGEVQRMLDAISGLTGEFGKGYQTLRKARREEEHYEEGSDDADEPPSLKGDERFPLLNQFMSEQDHRGGDLWAGYMAAKDCLRRSLSVP